MESGGTSDGFASQLGEKAMEQGASLLGEIAGGAGPGPREAEERLLKEFGEQAFKAFRGSETVETHSDRFLLSVCDGEFTVTVTASFLEARGEVRITSGGDCKCSPFAGGVRVGPFAVVGVAPLTFGNLRKQGSEWVLSCTLGTPHYDVWAPCCQVRDGSWVSPRETPPPVTAAEVRPTPSAADRKREADRTNVARRCDRTAGSRRRSSVSAYASTGRGRTAPRRACNAPRARSSRARWSNDPDSAEATLSMVRMREGLCACLKQQYGGKLPPDLEAFCNPRVHRNGASAPVLAASLPAAPTAPSQTAGGPPRFTAPPTCGSGEPLRIAGPFDGDPANTRIHVEGQPVRVSEETPRDCATQTTAGLSPGPAEILVTEGGRTTRLRTAVIRLRMGADQLDLLRGQSTKFQVVVEGLNGIPESSWKGGPDPEFLNRAALDRVAPGTRIPDRNEPGHLLLTIENASRDTITLAKSTGEVIRVEIRKGDVSAKGTYEYRGVIQSLRDGRFNVKGTVFALVAPAAGEPAP